MKKALSCALFVLIATSMVSPALGAADETKSKSPAKAPAKAAVKKPRPLPFHGRVSKVDAKAQTLTVGKRVFHLNDTTKLMKNDTAIPLQSVVIGERVGGSYLKDDNGNLHALKLNFKGLNEKAPKEAPPQKRKTDDPES
jgi:hypothetical protein